MRSTLDEPTAASENILNILTSVACVVLPIKSRVQGNREIWKNDVELNELIRVRSQHPIASIDYKETTKKIKKRVTRLRNEKLEMEAAEINEYANSRQVEELFRSIKADGSTFQDSRRKNGCDPFKLKEHFMKHFNHSIEEDDPIELTEIPDFIRKLQDLNTDDISTAPPNREEMQTTLKHLKNGKAANDIPGEYLKYAANSEELIDEMVSLYGTIWETHQIPKFWRHSKLVALWKGAEKGSLDDPKAHRGLQIGSTFCKILIIIIITRVRKWYENQLLDQQQGFRSGRGTADGIFVIKRIQQISDKMRKPTFLLFIDLSAAFDHINRKWLFKSIYQRLPEGANRKLFQLLQSLYEYTTTSLAEIPDDIFKLTLGVRQGGPESPPLFNLYMDYVMRVFMDTCDRENIKFLKLNYRVPPSATTREERYANTYRGNHRADWTGYADDLTLMFDDVDNLQKGINVLDETFKRFHLSINISKTKTMIVNHHYLPNVNSAYPKSISTLNSVPIENVKTFRYLGDEIKYDEPSTGDAEIELRIDVAECKFYELSKKLLNFNIHIKTRVLILNSMVRSRLTYSCQTWNLTTRQADRVNATYTSMLRKMIKGGFRRKKDGDWSFVLCNSDLHRICGTEAISTYTARQQRKYLAHLARQTNMTLTKRLLFNDDDAHKQGRRSNLEISVINNENCTTDTFYKKALNREY